MNEPKHAPTPPGHILLPEMQIRVLREAIEMLMAYSRVLGIAAGKEMPADMVETIEFLLSHTRLEEYRPGEIKGKSDAEGDG